VTESETDILSAGGILDWARRTLAPVSDTPRLDAEVLLAHACRTSRSSVIAFPEREVDAECVDAFRDSISRRISREPVAYILGEKEFYSLSFLVDPTVLVPRPETELIVDVVLSVLADEESVLDLGTGSGAIAIAIKKGQEHAKVTACDVSPGALSIARHNAAHHGLAVRFLLSNWFAGLNNERFDLIACNPPYVRTADVAEGSLAHEPRVALDGGGDGLDEIRSILAGVRQYLRPDGLLILEHGSDQQAAVIALAERHGLVVRGLERDAAGLDRVIVLGACRQPGVAESGSRPASQ
jgi:release factor glutamine methyltransferase